MSECNTKLFITCTDWHKHGTEATFGYLVQKQDLKHLKLLASNFLTNQLTLLHTPIIFLCKTMINILFEKIMRFSGVYNFLSLLFLQVTEK